MSHKPCPRNTKVGVRSAGLGAWGPLEYMGQGPHQDTRAEDQFPRGLCKWVRTEQGAQLAFPKGEGDLECGTPAPGGLGHEDSGSVAAAGASHPDQLRGEVHPVRVLLSYMLSKFRVSRKREPAEQGLLGGG